MSPHQQVDPEISVTTLVAGIVRDAQELVKEQFELLKHEIRTDVKKTEQAGLTLGVGLCFGLAGVLLFSLMLVEVLHEATPGLPLWSCYGIAGLAMCAVGGCLAYVGKRRLDSVHPLSDDSAQTLKENVQWITKRK
jgi:H+/Cl- antiporter ClcA